MSCPLQNAQLCGAKLKPKQRISPTYGSAMLTLLIARGENALQVNDETDALRRHQVGVRLAAAYGAERTAIHSVKNERRLSLLGRIRVEFRVRHRWRARHQTIGD